MTDLEMMRTPDEWPRWPILPMKRPRQLHPNCAVLCMTALPVPPKLYLGNFWDDKFDLTTCETKEYESLEAILQDGWVVD